MRDSSALGGALPFLQQFAKGGRVEHLLGQKLLQLRVLLFQGPQPLRLGNVDAAEFGLSIIDRRFGDPMLASQVRPSSRSLMLLSRPRQSALS
ncbi:hypothetical protein JJE66_36360 [Bradyrhizobium diazoefficiens]|nr:hypothetical protein [Bradyrhizobium diazoefficiens]